MMPFEVYAADTIPPVLSILGSDPMNTAYGYPFTDPGAGWTDNIDGSGIVLSISGTVTTNATGAYQLEYLYTDIAGNASNTGTRTVNVTDQNAPVITLSGSDPFTLAQGTPFVDPGATCIDNVDVTCTVNATGTVDHTQTGAYLVAYSAVDVAGNLASIVMRTVNVTA